MRDYSDFYFLINRFIEILESNNISIALEENKEIFNMKGNDNHVLFIKLLFDALVNYVMNNDANELLKLSCCHEFNIKKCENYYFTHNLIKSDLSFEKISNSLKLIQDLELADSLRLHNFILTIPESIELCRNVPIQFKALIYCSNNIDGLYLFTENPENGLSLSYKIDDINTTINVIIDNSPSNIICYIGRIYQDCIVKLSEIHNIKIIKIY